MEDGLGELLSKGRIVLGVEVLILVLVEDGLGELYGPYVEIGGHPVLILVLVEDGLGAASRTGANANSEWS